METKYLDARFEEMENKIDKLFYMVNVLYEIFEPEVKDYYEDLKEQEKEDMEKFDAEEEIKKEVVNDKNGKRTRERIKEE